VLVDLCCILDAWLLLIVANSNRIIGLPMYEQEVVVCCRFFQVR